VQPVPGVTQATLSITYEKAKGPAKPGLWLSFLPDCMTNGAGKKLGDAKKS